MEEELPLTFKRSPGLLNKERQIEVLSKQKRYEECRVLQKESKKMMDEERKAYMQIRGKKIDNALKDLRKKQEIDMHVLKKKCEAALNERLKFKRTEDAKIVQRYHNIRGDITNQ